MAFGAQRQMNWRNFWICFSVSLGQLAFGYPASIIGTTLGQPAFLLYMGIITPEGTVTKNADQLEGAMSGVFQVWHPSTRSQPPMHPSFPFMSQRSSRLTVWQAGAFFGVLIGSYVMDKWGRKVGMIYCATLSIIGGIMLCAAQDVAMFIAFRFVAGAGSWGFLALSMRTFSLASSPIN